MTTLDMTGRLGSSLRGTELVQRYRGDTNAEGHRHGKGSYAFPNKFFSYDGDFFDGQKHGAGKLSMADGGWYEGAFLNDEMMGLGRRVWSDGRSYEGQFVMGEMMGQGKYTLANGESYEGTMVSTSREGRGVLPRATGDVSDGEVQRNKPTGKGKQSLALNGEYYDGVRGHWGNCSSFPAQGSLCLPSPPLIFFVPTRSIGVVFVIIVSSSLSPLCFFRVWEPGAKDFVDGARHGSGTMSTPAGDSYTGGWVHGEKQGLGKGKDAESGVTYSGVYAFGNAAAIPERMEVAPAAAAAAAATSVDGEEASKDDAGEAVEAVEEEEGGDPVGTPEAPVTVTAGEALPTRVVRVRVRWGCTS